MSIFYLAHDLDDPAIRRRLRQLARAGEKVRVAGFRRRSLLARPPVEELAAELGRTIDGRLARRALSIIRAAVSINKWGRSSRGTEIILARGLEMLVLGALLQATFCRGRPLIYECLDIHRIMLAHGPIGRIMRLIEATLLKRSAAILTSSNAFITHYFTKHHREPPPFVVWENKVSVEELAASETSVKRSASVPWRIGWFGVLRCRRSLEVLRSLCESFPGLVEVDIRGRPTKELGPLIANASATTPGLVFGGEYDRSRDLATLYGSVHYTWAIDFFEEGANSSWLLPNRLYEGPSHLSVPVALESVETGRWLVGHKCGVILGEQIEETLLAFFSNLKPEQYQEHLSCLRDAGQETFVQTIAEVRALVASLRSHCRVWEKCRGRARYEQG